MSHVTKADNYKIKLSFTMKNLKEWSFLYN